MLSSIEILILSAVQGISEFLPISSSAHFILISKKYVFANQNLLIDICLHLGSLLAIIFYFRNDFFNFIQNKKFLTKILISTIPIIPVGYLLYDTGLIDKLRNLEVIGWTSLVFGILGDGGFQMNIQELQTINYLNLDIKLFIYNNFGYGIIKQFQDTYMSSRYEASGLGYSQPNFEEVANLFGFEYRKIESLEDLCIDDLCSNQKIIFDIMLDPNTEIEPKTEMGRVINDQFPYQTDEEFEKNNYFFLKSSDYNRPTN